MLIYMYNVEIQVYRVHVRRLAITKPLGNYRYAWNNINTYMYIVYIRFQFPKRKGKEDKLPDILSNKEGPFVHQVKGNDCSRFKAT